MAVPVVESFTTATTEGATDTTIDLDEPTGLAADDLILILFATEQANINDCPAITTPDAYTQIVHPDNSADVQGSLYWRISDGAETWPLTIAGTTGDFAGGWALRISGVNTTTPIHKEGAWVGEDDNNQTGSTIAEVTTTVNDCLGVFMQITDGCDLSPVTITSGVGWSIVTAANIQEPDANDAAGLGMDYGTKSISTAGGSTDIVIDFQGTGADGAMGIQVAIAPVVAAGGNPKGPLGMPLMGALGGPI